MIEATEGALVERVVSTIRWAAGIFRALPEQMPTATELEDAAEELRIAANALDRIKRPCPEVRHLVEGTRDGIYSMHSSRQETFPTGRES
jgi:hypothetical protein